MKIAIGTATGNIGSFIAKELSNTDNDLILLGRNFSKLKNLEVTNAKLIQLDSLNANDVINATRNCDALFWIIPPILTLESIEESYNKMIHSGATAVQQNDIKRVVLVSSLGSNFPGNLSTISYVNKLENTFAAICKNVAVIRPGYFMENLLNQKDAILKNNRVECPFDENHKIPFISTDDIGIIAANYLQDKNWQGIIIKELMGPEHLSMLDVVKMFSKMLNKNIKYKQITYEEIKIQTAKMGLNNAIQIELFNLYKALGDPKGIYSLPRTKEAFTPITLKNMINKKFLS
ncbi:NAD(P)H-binding protein [Flavobacterium sp. Fl-77]|uniref:NAD(P)H-binding protein n=1 Tax=Flavobacterium flavipigmentatum TaxID=2893884 RepID=A0AAJ2SEP4_9FLAO|nr:MULTISPECIES: NAD(P)H-binding protein [unclassified Flavobacterium]MDX6182427.1 NAD(P)H-binding protein [Flavobacterium sp. Fl-33]MDX6185660.1 NAD(P)H-binding protein [Flavobacterium sp. Fl-77]UFH38845.1 NAD(P)H-binding protein [Flavobacterium sp. F-70]